MRFTSTTIALALAASTTGCIHGWTPTETPGGSTEALDAETVVHTLSEPVRVSRGAQPLGLLAPGDRLRVSGDGLVLLPRAGAELALEGPDLLLEVSRVDHGLTALHTIVWSLSATATAIGSFFAYVFLRVAMGDTPQ